MISFTFSLDRFFLRGATRRGVNYIFDKYVYAIIIQVPVKKVYRCTIATATVGDSTTIDFFESYWDGH